MPDLGGLADKAKQAATDHPDQVQKGVDQAGDAVDERTGGAHAEQVDRAQQEATERLGGQQPDGS